ncbi:MAG TPA: Rieske (2Fe-2S) protein [Gemmatimonas aurantiaca]|uniref:Rieske domain-containing protein n=3 Tax=Gemmatimonas aurantiaca TaxID=173480 RepID=C1A8E7_GEMAT|nr:hypothetical protein GAU_1465 [Gemmatimonas aurantiaca T-27]HCT56166.1 Rieske (2Fe-2S) protein [Gemmatimonas aurantiaca]
MTVDRPFLRIRPMPSESTSCVSCAASAAGFDRRQFLASASVLSLGALVTTACGDGVISGPSVIPPFPSTPFTFDPRPVTALQQVGGRVVVSSGPSSPILVERLSTTQYRALSLVCPHKGTIVDVRSAEFVCPNHGARFALDGEWTGGQETASLAPVAVRTNADGTLTIGGVPTPPALALSSSSAVFVTSISGGTMAPQTIAVRNDGGGSVSGLQVSLAYAPNQRSGWLNVAIDQASTPATLTLTAARGTIPAGTYSATVTVSAPNVSTGAQTVAVTMLVQDPSSPASLLLSASALSFTVAQGTTPAAQTVECNNGGGGSVLGITTSVNYAPGAIGWLTTSLSSTTAPATLTLRPIITGLAVGTYTATVIVAASGLTNRTITVTLTVNPPGLQVTIAAWPALANVGGVAGSVGNVGGGPVAIVRTSANSFSAFSMVCPHAGTTILVVNGASFRCPNHGALFDRDGNNLPDGSQLTDDLKRYTVIYTPGAATLVVTL